MEEGNSSFSQSLAVYAPLLRAILRDDWKAAEAFIEENPNCLVAAITKDDDTALHFAAGHKRTRFVKNLVSKMEPKQLESKANNGKTTALYFAAQTEIVTIAEVMVKKNKELPSIFPKDSIQFLPLYAAIETGNRDMVSYLYSVTPIEDHLYPEDRIKLLKLAISTDLYDTALKILKTFEEKKLSHQKKEENKIHFWSDPLKMLARKPSEIGSKSEASLWARRLYTCFRGRLCNKAMMQASAHELVCCLWKKLVDDKNSSSTSVDQLIMKLLVEAAKVGNVEFLLILIGSSYERIWIADKKNGTLFHIAIKHRQEHVFNLIYEIGVAKGNLATYHVKGKNNMLHLAGESPSLDRLNIISGAALQMQRELLWFQKIEKIVPKLYVNQRNGEGKTPRDIFVKKHEELQKNGEKWMKDTANSCMLVATLIATVVFPAAFTVPGGNNQETGIPMFLESNWFMVFFISDAVAMLFSSSSILIFLSILTSRYTDKDFLISLPLKLVLGLTMLLISIVGMLIAFTAACFLVFKPKTSVPIRILVVAVPAAPICLFVILYLGLWFDIFRSAFYFNWFLFQSKNRLNFKPAYWLDSWRKNDNQCNLFSSQHVG